MSVHAQSRDRPPALATTREVAERLNTTTRTIRRYVRSGVLPAIRVQGLVRFDPADVERLIASGRETGE